MYNGWSQINGKNNFLGLWVKCRARPPRVSKRKKLRGFIHKWIFGVYAVSTLNELDICYIYYRFSRLTFIYFLSFCRFFLIELYYIHLVYFTDDMQHTLCGHCWFYGHLVYLPGLGIGPYPQRAICPFWSSLAGMLLHLHWLDYWSVQRQSLFLIKERDIRTYIYLRLFVVVYSYFVCVFHWLATCVFHHWLIYLSFFFFVFT
jgi:hypothetical protein